MMLLLCSIMLFKLIHIMLMHILVKVNCHLILGDALYKLRYFNESKAMYDRANEIR